MDAQRSDGRPFSWWLTELIAREDTARKARNGTTVERVPARSLERVARRSEEREDTE